MSELIEAIYARQSIDKKDSVSIEAQIEMCKKYLRTDKYEIYHDKGFSAKTIDRPRMNDLNEDIKNGKISRVIAYRLDRISRNIVDFGNLLTMYENNKVEFISATENFDTSTPMGRAMVYIVMVFAQLERETIAGRITDNYKFRSSTGKYFMGGGIPYGYKVEKSLIDGKKASVIIPSENSEILQMIFQRYTSGFNINQIVHELNENGYKTSLNKPWHPTTLKRVLRNITPCVADKRMYDYLLNSGYNITNNVDDFDAEHGICIFLKSKNRNEVDISEQVVTVGLHRPFIPSEQYIKAQINLDKNLEQSNKKTSKRTFLAGLVQCAECGYSFGVKTTFRKNKTYAYYFCRSRHTRGNCNNDIWIKSDELEKYIVERCINHLNTLPQNITHETEKNNQTNYNDEISLLEQQLENFVDNIGRGNSVVDGLLTDKITRIQKRINDIKVEKQKSTIVNIFTIDVKNLKEQLKNIDNLSIDEKIATIKQIVVYVKISNNKKIDIKYKF